MHRLESRDKAHRAKLGLSVDATDEECVVREKEIVEESKKAKEEEAAAKVACTRRGAVEDAFENLFDI